MCATSTQAAHQNGAAGVWPEGLRGAWHRCSVSGVEFLVDRLNRRGGERGRRWCSRDRVQKTEHFAPSTEHETNAAEKFPAVTRERIPALLIVLFRTAFRPEGRRRDDRYGDAKAHRMPRGSVQRLGVVHNEIGLIERPTVLQSVVDTPQLVVLRKARPMGVGFEPAVAGAPSRLQSSSAR